MARLIFSKDLRNADRSDLATWYFADANVTTSSHYNPTKRYEFDISKTYAYCNIIHVDHLNPTPPYTKLFNGNIHKIAIREWVARCCINDVIHDFNDMSYNFESMHSMSYGNGRTTVEHGYHIFYFINEAEASAFSFAFADIIVKTMSEFRIDADSTILATARKGRA